MRAEQGVTGRYRALQGGTGRYGAVPGGTGRYGAEQGVTARYSTEQGGLMGASITFRVMVVVLLAQLAGCSCIRPHSRENAYAQLEAAAASSIPRELAKATLPEYRVEPPDILLVDAVNNIRPTNDELRAGDQILIRASNTLPIDLEGDQLTNEFRVINTLYSVQSDGTVDLGPEYGTVHIEGVTLEAAKALIITHLRDKVGLAQPSVAISMPDVAGKQLIAGEHLVRPDGTIALGVYGAVYVSGHTLPEIKDIIETYLKDEMHNPEVSVDVLGYNSKQIYIVSDGGGFGETVTRLPFTGNETVLDAISEVQGLSEVSSKTIWVARPAPSGTNVAQTMLVDWEAITRGGITTTNYQLFPGDRIFIEADHQIAFDNAFSKFIAPLENFDGFALLNLGLWRAARNVNQIQGGGGGGGF